MSSDAGIKINLAEAVRSLPGPQKENVVTVFEHGSLVTKLHAPRVIDPQTPNSRDEVDVVAQGAGESFAEVLVSRSSLMTCCSSPPASSTDS